MISFLNGVVVSRQTGEIVIDVNGVGYDVWVSMNTLFQLPESGQPVQVHTHLAIREDAHVLYGFSTLQERTVFRKLIKISGVGPKVALSILSALTVSDLSVIVQKKDVTAMTKVPGIGKKTAERLLVELQDKMTDLGDPAIPNLDGVLRSDVAGETESALVSLGYKTTDASKLVKQYIKPEMTTDDLIRIILKSMVSR